LMEETRHRGKSWVKRQYFEAAQQKFGPHLTETLFRGVWESAQLPKEVRESGSRSRQSPH
jgi:hypothetical protein